MQETNKITVKGVWLPGEVAFNPNLSWTDKMVWWIIDSLDNENHCIASNEYIGKVLNLSEKTISQAISKLISHKYLIQTSFNGRKRILRTNEKMYLMYRKYVLNFNCLEENVKADFTKSSRQTLQKGKPISNSLYKNSLCSSSSKEEDNNENQGFSGSSQEKSFKRPSFKKDETPLIKEDKVPSDINEIITFWNNLGLRQHKNPNAKIYKKIITSLRKVKQGVFFNKSDVLDKYKRVKFSQDDILKSIQRFSLAALSPDYLPDNGFKEYLKKLSLADFIYNGRADKQKSQFLVYYESEPELAKKSQRLPNDSYPKLTNCIQRIYIKKVLGGIGGRTQKQVRDYRLASQNLYDFFTENKKKINTGIVFSSGSKESSMADILIDSIIHDVGESNIQKISSGYLSSEMTFTHRLPAFMFQQGCLKE